MNPNRQKLIDALRSPMPSGFSWDFSRVLQERECGTVGCALGLATIVFPETLGDTGDVSIDDDEAVAKFFSLNLSDFGSIFYCPRSHYGVDTSKQVTPNMVADALEGAP